MRKHVAASILTAVGWGALTILQIDIEVGKLQDFVVLQVIFVASDRVFIVYVGKGLSCFILVPIVLSKFRQFRL